jgi:hypothetical protein
MKFDFNCDASISIGMWYTPSYVNKMTWILSALLHAALITTSISQQDPLNYAKNLWSAAMDAWEKENSEESLRYLNQLKKVQPNYPLINLAFGAIYHRNVGLK